MKWVEGVTAANEIRKLQDLVLRLSDLAHEWREKHPLQLFEAKRMASDISLSWSFLVSKLQELEEKAIQEASAQAQMELKQLQQLLKGGM